MDSLKGRLVLGREAERVLKQHHGSYQQRDGGRIHEVDGNT